MTSIIVIVGIAITFFSGIIVGYIGKIFLDDLSETDVSRPHDDYD